MFSPACRYAVKYKAIFQPAPVRTIKKHLAVARASSRSVLPGPSQRPRNAILSGQRTVIMNREYSLRGLPLATQSELVSGGRIRTRKGGAHGRVGCCAAGTDIQHKAAGGVRVGANYTAAGRIRVGAVRARAAGGERTSQAKGGCAEN